MNNLQTLLGDKAQTIDPPFDRITKDVTQTLIQFLAEKGHGKSSSLATIVKHCIEGNKNLRFKIFDISQYWFHRAPVPYRQFVSLETMRANLVFNLENCVYEMGRMTEDQQRAFVASIINQDYVYRYDLKKENDGRLDDLPWIVYVFEEADIYFSSRSFMKNDDISPVLKKFVSVGRNFKLSGFLVATAEMGEVATKLRRRSRKIYGRIESAGDLAMIKRRDKESWTIVKDMPKYHFIYFAGTGTPPFRIRDEVKTVPVDVTRPQEETEIAEEIRVVKPLPWIVQILLGFGLSLLAFLVAQRLGK